MRFVPLFLLAGAVYTSTAVVAQFHIRCQNTIGGPCGDSSRPREYNCCDYGYCQPWNSGYYQCLDTPPKCPKQETDIDYAGNDIKTIYSIQPNQCCEACSTTTGCTAYTFVNQNPDGRPACYLKTSAAGRVEKKGAVSGQLADVPPPPNCPVQEMNTDYYGNDIKNVIGLTQAQCCDACGATANCAAYTFIPTAMDGKSACYLKYSTAGRRAKAGAISGQVKDVPPPANCPTTEKDTDYFGNDIRTVRDVSLAQCCDACSTTTGCKVFSYVEKDWDGKASCYLKSSAAGKVAKPGVTSGALKCTTQPLGQCGSASTGALCCPDGTYCQPWNPSYYQCIPNPPTNKCSSLIPNMDFYGGDLEVLYNLVPESCCDACFNNPECKLFTFVNYNPDGRSACYLKTNLGERRIKYGAVSGYKVIAHGH